MFPECWGPSRGLSSPQGQEGPVPRKPSPGRCRVGGSRLWVSWVFVYPGCGALSGQPWGARQPQSFQGPLLGTAGDGREFQHTVRLSWTVTSRRSHARAQLPASALLGFFCFQDSSHCAGVHRTLAMGDAAVLTSLAASAGNAACGPRGKLCVPTSGRLWDTPFSPTAKEVAML